MCGHKIFLSKQIKYVGIYIDEYLNFSYHCSTVATKLRRATGMLCKARHYLDQHNLRNLYFAIFSSHLIYGAQIWGQVKNCHTENIFKIQKKGIRIISFADRNSPSNPLFFSRKILKLEDQIKLFNCQFVFKCLHNTGPSCFDAYFQSTDSFHNYNTRRVIKSRFGTKFSCLRQVTCQ